MAYEEKQERVLKIVQKLQHLHRQIRQCTACPLCMPKGDAGKRGPDGIREQESETGRGNSRRIRQTGYPVLPVPGEYIPVTEQGKISVLCLGRNPGKTENGSGRPFAGASGRVLRKYLAPWQDVANVSFSNVVKCHIYKDACPTVNEIEFCAAKWIKREIDVLQPDVLILIGTEALNVYWVGEKITKRSGECMGELNTQTMEAWRTGEDPQFALPVFALLHPAHLLRERQFNFDEARIKEELFKDACVSIHKHLAMILQAKMSLNAEDIDVDTAEEEV
jgi:uracil-DNA glycosylase family 4